MLNVSGRNLLLISVCILLGLAALAQTNFRAAALEPFRSWLFSRASESELGTPATMVGLVTCFDTERGVLFLQNATSAARVETNDLDQVSIGQKVEASGLLTRDTGLSLQSASVKSLAVGHLPVPTPVRVEQLSESRFANRLVTLSGRASGAFISRLGSLEIALQPNSPQVSIRILNWSGLDPKTLAGVNVVITGVLDQTADSDGNVSRVTLVTYDQSGLKLATRPSEQTASNRQVGGTTELPALTHVSDIRQLSPAEASRRYPVQLNGVVTFSQPGHHSFFVQDKTGGIYVDASGGDPPVLRAGQHIHLSGFTEPGQLAPIVASPRFQIDGQVPMPEAIPADVSQILSGSLDSQWIETTAVIRSVKMEETTAILRADTGGMLFDISVLDVQKTPTSLVDAKVRVRGVCGSESNLRRQMVGFHMQVPSPSDIRVESRTTPLPGEPPLYPISEFGTFHPHIEPAHRERVQGTITFVDPHGNLYIQDDSGALQIDPQTAPQILRVGDSVNAVGYARPGLFGPVMAAASIQRGPSRTSVLAHKVQAGDLLEQGSDGELVQVDALLLARFPSQSGETLLLRSGHITFSAILLNQIGPAASKDAILQLTGVCSLQSTPQRPLLPVGLNLLLRSPRDIQVLRNAPWWNGRAISWAFIVVSFLALLTALWATTLRFHVRRQTRVIQQQLTEAESLRAKAESATQAKSEFLTNMSHEIRTPLNGILGMTDLALSEPISPPARDYLNTARECGFNLLDIISNVLDLARIEQRRVTINSAPFDLNEMLESVIASLSAAAKSKNIGLHCHYPASLPHWFVGDPLRIRQVALNLIANAVKFTEIGSVTTTVSCHSIVDGTARVRIAIRDTGIGISEEEQSRLFLNFSQADSSTTRKYGGSGLGLAISKQLTTLMGGTIGVESVPGQGSTFWCELPLVLIPKPDAPIGTGPSLSLEPDSKSQSI